MVIQEEKLLAQASALEGFSPPPISSNGPRLVQAQNSGCASEGSSQSTIEQPSDTAGRKHSADRCTNPFEVQ